MRPTKLIFLQASSLQHTAMCITQGESDESSLSLAFASFHEHTTHGQTTSISISQDSDLLPLQVELLKEALL